MNKTKRSFFGTHIPIIIFLVFYFSVISYKLISHPTPFFDWDESIYVQVGREMAEKNSLIPLWQGAEWLEKPPLAPLAYGLIIKYIPVQPEISTRMFSLGLAILALILIYAWVSKSTSSNLLATLVVALTAFNPLFIQKSQTVNTDVWLIIGFLGYLLTFPSFWWSFLFLFTGVFSKSLLGFYPAIMIGGLTIYKKLTDRIYKKEELWKVIQIILIQCSVLLIWYLIMLILYRNEFITVHFRDHLIRRVTQSVESKFGKRTYYFDLIIGYYGYLSVVCVLSIGILLYRRIKKYISTDVLFSSLFLLPYFLFLNLTKTKIEWYVYPAIALATFLIVYPLIFLQKMKPIFIFVCVALIAFIIYRGIYTDKFFNSYYSQYDDSYKLAVNARNTCNRLYVLLDGGSRNTHDTLQKLGLLLSTTEIYGNHPAMVYYFGKKTNFIYSVAQAQNKIKSADNKTCLAIDSHDTKDFENLKKQKKEFGSLYMYY